MARRRLPPRRLSPRGGRPVLQMPRLSARVPPGNAPTGRAALLCRATRSTWAGQVPPRRNFQRSP
eukprot:4762534-Lingulodinium_polyedra.AAC.1